MRKMAEGIFTPKYLCFALYLIGLYLGRTVFVDLYPSFDLFGVLVTWEQLRSSIGVAVSAACIVLCRLVDNIATKGRWQVAATLLAIAGVCLIYLPKAIGLFAGQGVLVATVFVGDAFYWIGQSLIFVSLVCLFSSERTDNFSLFSAFVVSMIAVCLICLMPIEIARVLQVVVMAGILLLLRACAKDVGIERHHDYSENFDAVSLTIRFFLFVAVLSLATSYMKHIGPDAPDGANPLRAAVMLLCAAIACVMAYVSTLSYKSFGSIAFYRSTVLFFTVAFCAVPILSDLGYAEVSSSICFVADLMFRTLTFLVICKMCARTTLSPALLASIAALIRTSGGLLAAAAAPMLLSSERALLASTLCFIATATVVYIVCFTEKDVFTLTEKGSVVASAENEKERLQQRCERIAETYGLSKREHEILEYLCQRKTAPYIAEQLFLSPRTVNTHVGNIYKKMGIHSRGDLLAAYESIE